MLNFFKIKGILEIQYFVADLLINIIVRMVNAVRYGNLQLECR
jgi:hypothetical protein